ncbi:MAG TPA: hypothetical protein VI356_12040 [Myxococcales bacterium]
MNRKVLRSCAGAGAVVLTLLAACSNNNAIGKCAGDADCPSGLACNAQHACVAPAGTTPPDVAMVAPASGAVADGTLTAVATAHAPGGVTSLTFEVRSTAGALFVTAPGTASATDPSSFSAAIPLAAAADGSAIVQAVIAYGSGQRAQSTAVQILIDQHAPAIALQTDGRATLLAGGQTATVTAQIGDGAGTGVLDSSVFLRIANHPDVAGAGTGGLYTFSLPIDDSLSAAGTSVTVPFQIAASDRLGHTATMTGDPRAVLRIDRDAPKIAEIAVISDGFTRPDGTKVFDPIVGAIKVQATITDAKGVDDTTVCLHVSGGPCVPGTNKAGGNVYSFDMPAPVGTFDGETVPFTISADDLFSATLPAAFKAEHQATSPAQPVAYDNTPPVVTVAADAKPYARSGAPVDVVATITDGTGVGTVGLSSKTALPVTSAGNIYTLKLSPADAPAGVEGPFGFNVVAQDSLGHTTTMPTTRVIDGAPPQLSVQIFKSGDPVPSSTGVTYPAAVPNTGWTGSTFIYSDSVRLRVTFTDLSGVGSATLRVDGIELNGAVSPGTPQALPLFCPQGAGSCTFDADLKLAGFTSFHTSGGGATGTIPLGVDSIPAGSLQFVIDAQDAATSFGVAQVPAPNLGTQRTAVQATRFLWKQTLAGDPALTAVSGLAIHPSGDVIVTTSGAAGDVYALAPDRPHVLWNGSAATSAPIAGINGMPAVGSGDATSALIYVASATGVLFAFDANGSLVWTTSTGAPFAVGPAIASVGTPAIDEIVIPDAAQIAKAGNPVAAKLWRATSATDVTSVASDEQDSLAAPLILNGGVYFATQPSKKSTAPATHVVMQPIAADGSFPAASLVLANHLGVVVNGVDPFFGLVTDGTSVFAATNGSTVGSLFAFNSALSQIWRTSLAQSLAAEPTLAADGKLYGADLGKNTNTYDLTNGAPTRFVTAIGGTGMVPLQGANGRTYFPSNGSQALLAYAGNLLFGNQLSWQLKTAANMFRAATIDCQGRLFAAAGNTVYALVSDDPGLAETPWPSLRRDSRNTGNAGAAKYGMRITATGGCIQ